MSDEQNSPESRRKRRSTSTRGKLRRFNTIDNVTVEETFSLSLPDAVREGEDAYVGDGCYVSALVGNSKRYYGVLIEQSALKSASMLHFQGEARSLDLNRRMKALMERQDSRDRRATVAANLAKGEHHALAEQVTSSPVEENGGHQLTTEIDTATHKEENGGEPHRAAEAETVAPNEDDGERKRPPETLVEDAKAKRVKTEALSSAAVSALPRIVQKLRYVGEPLPGYRELLATYASVEEASEDDADKARQIEEACQSGGDFVGDRYYQFEASGDSLQVLNFTKPFDDVGIRTSLGLNSFLTQTDLPLWFPLSNLETGQHKVLSMLQMKRSNNGDVVFDDNASMATEVEVNSTLLPMEPRSRYRVVVVGAGIAGLSCASELLLQGERQNIDVEVVVIEGRSRIGGRLLTDDTTFKCDDGETPFLVDLGASWIHGIDNNPLAALAKEAGLTFATASEEVKMLTANMGTVNPDLDERIGELFDELLDQAADDCWDQDDFKCTGQRSQYATRWYASVLGPGSRESKGVAPVATDAPPHRWSSDVSVDHSIGKIMAKENEKEFAIMSAVERSLLLWNMKNIEYALGANISDLSMKFWDSDDRHAFEGDHVLLEGGYSQVVRHMLRGLEAKGDRFQLVRSCPAGKVEYARKTSTLSFPDTDIMRRRKMIDLSDTCCVTSREGDRSFKGDFVVSALPLGVLKDSIESDPQSTTAVSFQPPLPFSKRDSISNVGFGLLNKVFLQFPTAFWRLSTVLPDGQLLFGNASGVNPHHYMFFDVGRSFKIDDSPAILMTLISGKEAVETEHLSDNDIVKEVLRTLRTLFSDETVPAPISSKATRWGGDEFSRGSYTFLPPGASDQDFQILQSPVNGNGDSLVLDGSETMRLFWAGEHTTSLHPSMAHGALLSGIRAAKEVMSTIQFLLLEGTSSIDKLIPLAIFRKSNPNAPLKCSLCNLTGSREREGSLLAFQRGSRQVLAHNACVENSPEVEVLDGHWKNVIKAINRGKQINCALCDRAGATVGCTHPNCFRSYHFCCGEDTGWQFERDGKVFFCDRHRVDKDVDPGQCDRISIKFVKSKYPKESLSCRLCGVDGDDKSAGSLLAFQQSNQHILIHDKCARYTTLVGTVEHDDSGERFHNILEASVLSKAHLCEECKLGGASIGCSEPGCTSHYHFTCASVSGWEFGRKRQDFRCVKHRNTSKLPVVNGEKATNGSNFQHNLFSLVGASDSSSRPNRVDPPSNAEANGSIRPQDGSEPVMRRSLGDEGGHCTKDVSSDEESDADEANRLSADALLATGMSETSVIIQRNSCDDPWSVAFYILSGHSRGKSGLCIESPEDACLPDGLKDGDIVTALNGVRLGQVGCLTVEDVLSEMKIGKSIELAVCRADVGNDGID